MKDRVVGRFPLHLGSVVEGVEAKGGDVQLRIRDRSGSRSTLGVDHVIAATGYKPVVRRLPFLDEALLEQMATLEQAPILNRHFECSVPGLFWVGLASANSFGPLTRFAFGAKFTARRLSRHLASSLRFEAPPTLAEDGV